MGKSILVKNGNFKSLRPGIPKLLMPNNIESVTDLFIGAKYIEDEGWTNAIRENDAFKSDDESGRSYSFPSFVESSGVFSGRSVLRFNRDFIDSGDVLRINSNTAETFSFTIQFYIVVDLSDPLCPFSFTFSDNQYVTFLRHKNLNGNPESVLLNSHKLTDWVQLFETSAGQRDTVTVQQTPEESEIYHNGVLVYSDNQPLINSVEIIDIGQRPILESSMNPFDGTVNYAEVSNKILSHNEVSDKHAQLADYYAIAN